MNKIWAAAISASMLLVCACGRDRGSAVAEDTDTADTAVTIAEPEPEAPAIPDGAAALIHAYPDFVKGYKDGRILMANGSEMVYDDGKEKTFEQTLDNTDIEDMFSIPYTTGRHTPGYLEDPGRARNEALFRAMYGNSADEVARRLVSVDWFGGNVRITSVNGAADSLRAVKRDLQALGGDTPSWLTGSSTFYWRNVRGANRLSAHSYGIAIDINTSRSDYWLWSNPKASETARISYANRIPLNIVDAFERHGFIWGGKWYHYDTMHFEFRPDLLYYSRK